MHDYTEIIMSICIIIVTAIIRALMVEMIVRDNNSGRMDYRDFYHTLKVSNMGMPYSRLLYNRDY